MSVSIESLEQTPIEALLGDDIIEVREWERFKWFARQLESAVDRYEVERLEQLLSEPPSFPGHREKILVLLALDASPRAVEVLEAIDTDREAADFAQLRRVALRVATGGTRQRNWR